MPNNKRKRKFPTIEEVLDRPWCYYCERDFDDLKVLTSHQKAKHFKCSKCNRRLNTAGGLAVHLNQVHKEELQIVENALPGREGADIEIFGMEGIPDDIKDQHDMRIKSKFFEELQERQRLTGNPQGMEGKGAIAGVRIKLPSIEELKQHFEDYVTNQRSQALQGQDPSNGALSVPSHAANGAIGAPPAAVTHTAFAADSARSDSAAPPPEKKAKKSKDKAKLFYSDDNETQEEKLLGRAKFYFDATVKSQPDVVMTEASANTGVTADDEMDNTAA